MIKNKRIFLTGGAGFIGTKLCEIFCEDNELLIFDSLRRNSIKNTCLLDRNNVKLVVGDVLDGNRLKEAIQEFKPQVILHLAAIAGIDTVIKNPLNTMKVNMIGTYNILEAVAGIENIVERFVIFSTSEVFGSFAYKVDENSNNNLAPVGEARWTYSISKLAGEHLAYSYYKEHNLPVVIIRPFNVYGPGQVGEGAIHTFVAKAIKNERIEIHNDGDQIRSWCYIDDFIHGVLLCIEKDEAVGNTFNIGNPRGTTTIYMLAKLVKNIAGSQSEIVNVPKHHADVELRMPSIDKAKQILGYNPQYDLESGLKKTIDWYRGRLNDKAC